MLQELRGKLVAEYNPKTKNADITFAGNDVIFMSLLASSVAIFAENHNSTPEKICACILGIIQDGGVKNVRDIKR